eukprot:5876291-Prorocentrum_lima.AAC.1
MTSSLVGSEMCIRDRGKGDSYCDDNSDINDSVSRHGHCLREIAVQSTVSYTHLTLPTICSV